MAVSEITHSQTMKTYYADGLNHEDYMIQTYIKPKANELVRATVFFYSDKAQTYIEVETKRFTVNKEDLILSWASSIIANHSTKI